MIIYLVALLPLALSLGLLWLFVITGFWSYRDEGEK